MSVQYLKHSVLQLQLYTNATAPSDPVCWLNITCRIKIAIKDLKEGEEQDLWLDFDNPKEEVCQHLKHSDP